MTAATGMQTMTPERARALVRRINDQGVAEPLVNHSLSCEDSLWNELLEVCLNEGSSLSREFRRWAQSKVSKA